MMMCLSTVYRLIFLLAGVTAAGVGEAWQITPHVKSVYNDQLRPRLDSSAFEVRTVSGVGRWTPFNESENVRKQAEIAVSSSVESNDPADVEETVRENKSLEYLRKFLDSSSYSDDEVETVPLQKIFKKTLMMRILHANDANEDNDENEVRRGTVQRTRRQANNETSMEKISTAKNVREVRVDSPETWSTSVQPISVEFRQHIPLDQIIRQQQEEEEAASLSGSYRRHQAPRADFITGQHHRRSYPEYRESRDMVKTYDDYDYMSPWYRNAIRERDYEYPSYRRDYGYQYPDRYRTERNYYMRLPSDSYYYDRYDRYRDDDFDFYARNRLAPKPRRIIYYATLPEVVRKPVDLRNPRPPYDAGRTPVTREGTYNKRVPGNVDPGRYRYQYGGYDPYAKRSSYYDRPYVHPEDDTRRVRVPTKENFVRNDEFGATNNERKVSNLITIRDDDNKLPWPVQVGAEVNIKEDERIPGRKIYGEQANSGYERFQSAQLQKAPDATGSSELQSDN
ncbi:uncharacterized protein LOC109853642 [Pseudomyrmex gracilis]|uniref:uncharacterized protein LOC109853642 n=1 Tax=Pseudomyrmex gracilis TaxID=219809 RepID=UPI00099504D5|nr:uncharacterized protein LOC109853642 [Pseudomyrmex gracilis]